MSNKKVFRVYLSERRHGFVVDIEADSASKAMAKVRQRLDDPNDYVEPLEYPDAYTEFVVDDAEEIDREDADLD